MQLGEVSYFFVPRDGAHSHLLCRYFGVCSTLDSKCIKRSGQVTCFCHQSLIVYVDLLQINGKSKLDTSKFSNFIPDLMSKRISLVS